MEKVVMKVLKYNICTMLDQRQRRWADIVQMFVFQIRQVQALFLCAFL